MAEKTEDKKEAGGKKKPPMMIIMAVFAIAVLGGAFSSCIRPARKPKKTRRKKWKKARC